jgi:hypothetical protein
VARWLSDSWRLDAPENTRLSDQISTSVASKPFCSLVPSQAFQNLSEGTHEPGGPAARDPLAVSCPGAARGFAPWFPKNLHNRAWVLLGLPRVGTHQPACWPRAAPWFLCGSWVTREGRCTLSCPAGSSREGFPGSRQRQPLTILLFLSYPPARRRRADPRGR